MFVSLRPEPHPKSPVRRTTLVVGEKRLKETETEETIVFFCHIFVICDISIGGRPGPPCLRLWV